MPVDTVTKKITQLEQRVRMLELMQRTKVRRAQILRETGGALDGKLPKNLVAWQRRVRSEWDARVR